MMSNLCVAPAARHGVGQALIGEVLPLQDHVLHRGAVHRERETLDSIFRARTPRLLRYYAGLGRRDRLRPDCFVISYATACFGRTGRRKLGRCW